MENSREIAIANAKLVLKQAGYYIDVLWHVDDVKNKFECNDDQAQKVLHNLLSNEYIVTETFSQMDEFAEIEGLKLKEE